MCPKLEALFLEEHVSCLGAGTRVSLQCADTVGQLERMGKVLPPSTPKRQQSDVVNSASGLRARAGKFFNPRWLWVYVHVHLHVLWESSLATVCWSHVTWCLSRYWQPSLYLCQEMTCQCRALVMSAGLQYFHGKVLDQCAETVCRRLQYLHS